MYELTGFQRDLVYCIAYHDEPYDLALKEVLETYYEQDIYHGRLYPNLDELVDKGLVEKGLIGRRTNVYTFTRRGPHGNRSPKGVRGSVRRRVGRVSRGRRRRHTPGNRPSAAGHRLWFRTR